MISMKGVETHLCQRQMHEGQVIHNRPPHANNTHNTPLLTANAAVQTLLSTPVHSNTVGGALYSSFPAPKSPRIAAAFSSAPSPGSIRYVTHPGTTSRAKASRFGSTSVMTSGWAPEARAAARATRPMGPAPQIRAGRPRERPPVVMPWRTTLRGSRRAASSKVTFSGILRVAC